MAAGPGLGPGPGLDEDLSQALGPCEPSGEQGLSITETRKLIYTLIYPLYR